MGTPCFAIAPQKRVFARINENKRHRVVFPQVPVDRGQFLELRAFPRVHQQRRPGKFSLSVRVDLGEHGNQIDRQVVHAVETHVLKRLEDRALPRSGKSSKNDELRPFASGGTFHAGRPVRTSPAAGACWGYACLPGIWRRSFASRECRPPRVSLQSGRRSAAWRNPLPRSSSLPPVSASAETFPRLRGRSRLRRKTTSVRARPVGCARTCWPRRGLPSKDARRLLPPHP